MVEMSWAIAVQCRNKVDLARLRLFDLPIKPT